MNTRSSQPILQGPLPVIRRNRSDKSSRTSAAQIQEITTESTPNGDRSIVPITGAFPFTPKAKTRGGERGKDKDVSEETRGNLGELSESSERRERERSFPDYQTSSEFSEGTSKINQHHRSAKLRGRMESMGSYENPQTPKAFLQEKTSSPKQLDQPPQVEESHETSSDSRKRVQSPRVALALENNMNVVNENLISFGMQQATHFKTLNEIMREMSELNDRQFSCLMRTIN